MTIPVCRANNSRFPGKGKIPPAAPLAPSPGARKVRRVFFIPMKVSVLFLAFSLSLSAVHAKTEDKKALWLESSSTEWCPVNALLLGEASGLAYDSTALETAKQTLGCKQCEKLDFPVKLPSIFKFEEGELGPQGFIAGGPEHIIISFRGTETNLVDMLTGTWAQPMSLADGVPGMVHGGFAATFHGLWPELKGKLALLRRDYPEAKVWITGHSMGGAMAVMAAATLTLVEKQPVQGVITFGAPVTGDAAFHEALDRALAGRQWRCIHQLDFVTIDPAALRLPVRMPSELTRFKHGGTAVYLNNDGTVARNGRSAMRWEMLELAIRWIKARKITPPADVLTRHSMGGGYLPALRKLQEASPGTK